MKACEEYIDLMMRSIDRETEPQEEARLRAHLADCEACRALYEAYQAVDRSIQSAEEEPPEQLTAAIMNSIRREKAQAQPKHWFQRYKFTMIAAAAAVVLIFARVGGNISLQSATTASDSAAAEAAAAPEVAAEFRSGAQEPAAEAAEEAPEMAMAAEAAPAEAGATETEIDVGETQMQEAGAQAAEQNLSGIGEADERISASFGADRVTALENAGYYGTVLLVSGVDEQTLLELLPELTAAAVLENGETAYEASRGDVDALIAQGTLNVAAAYEPEEPEPADVCWIILES